MEKKPDDKLLMSHTMLKMNIQLHYTAACPGAFALDGKKKVGSQLCDSKMDF
jgi:hypothetical protein